MIYKLLYSYLINVVYIYLHLSLLAVLEVTDLIRIYSHVQLMFFHMGYLSYTLMPELNNLQV